MFNYSGVLVTGTHKVKEGTSWMKVMDSRFAIPVRPIFNMNEHRETIHEDNSNDDDFIFNIDTHRHRIVIADHADILFADFQEVNDEKGLLVAIGLQLMHEEEEPEFVIHI